MPIKIETFSNAKGGNSFFKALGHPLAADKAAASAAAQTSDAMTSMIALSIKA